MSQLEIIWDIKHKPLERNNVIERIKLLFKKTKERRYILGKCERRGEDIRIIIFLKSICCCRESEEMILKQINETFLHEMIHSIDKTIPENQVGITVFMVNNWVFNGD